MNKVEKPVEAVKPAPVIPTPSLPEVKNEEKPKVEEPVVRPSVLSFAGVQFETSDGFILNENTVGTPTSLGLVIDHNGHQHFVYYKQLVNSKFEKLIPEKYLEQAKKEYKELEDKVTEKINYLSSKNNIDKNTIKYVSTAQGDALSYDGKTTLLDNINVNDVTVAPTEKPAENNKEENNTENKENYSVEKISKNNHTGIYENGQLVSNFTEEELRLGAQRPLTKDEIQYYKSLCRYAYMSDQDVIENHCQAKKISFSRKVYSN
ncbi:hypothetical protein [Haemophilus parahaemolyticus]|uniref:hypothetical protein n=1 Tax=Haemophilus parahaemolyticus TaxID=735 RepID=UPI003CD0DBDD